MTKNLSVHIEGLTVTVGDKIILNDISFVLPKGRITAVVGESGSGKTTLSLSLLGLLAPSMRQQAKVLMINNQDLLNASQQQMQKIRGQEVGMVFQEPLAAFDPLFTIGYHLTETLKTHLDLTPPAFKERINAILTLVGLAGVDNILKRYPHQLSGGQRQRAMMALACVCHPSLLIADEPTSSLDYDLQEHIIDAFRHLNQQLKMSLLIVTHDLSVVSALAENIIVLKEGIIVESGRVVDVMKHPKHPYTKRLIEAS